MPRIYLNIIGDGAVFVETIGRLHLRDEQQRFERDFTFGVEMCFRQGRLIVFG